MDKKTLAQKIKTLEGLTDQERSDLLGLLNTKRYGLVWEDKPEAVEQELAEKLPVLNEVKERAIISDNDTAPNHILIEGDNLEALTTLAYTHAGKIDVIYIDPPYNTGKKDGSGGFIYNDSFVDTEDQFRHSKWLSFMEKRLRIARQLLSDKGVIFISIDDNEQAQLKLLCDEVFGEKNHIGNLIWQSATDNNPRQISTEHEYIICYAKQSGLLGKWLITSINAQRINKVYKDFKKNCSDINEQQKLLRSWIKTNKSTLKGVEHYNNVDEYGVYSNSSNSSNTKPGGYSFDIIHPVTKKPCSKPAFGWRWPESTFLSHAAHGNVEWGKDETTQPHIKKRIETVVEQLKSIYYEDGRASTKMLEDLFNGIRAFNNPKPINLIKRIEAFSSSSSSTVLDFFAGSGTTLHATMQLNAADGGNRQCILVTNNENGICEQVTYERNRRVICGYTNAKGEEVAGLSRNTLRYYRTGFVPRERTPHNMRQLVACATDMLCIKENIYAEEEHFGTLPTAHEAFRFFAERGESMLVIYDEGEIERIVEEIASIQPQKPIRVYVFSPSEDPWQGEFEEVASSVQLCALPQAIYNAYRNVLPKQNIR